MLALAATAGSIKRKGVKGCVRLIKKKKGVCEKSEELSVEVQNGKGESLKIKRKEQSKGNPVIQQGISLSPSPITTTTASPPTTTHLSYRASM